MPRTPNPKKTVPPFLAQARGFYAEAFAHRRKSELAEAMAEWGELDESEQSFAIAHLAFLHLEAQAVTQQLLVNVRDLLDELAEAFTVAIEASLAQEEEDLAPEDPPALALPLPVAATDVIDAEPPEDAQ